MQMQSSLAREGLVCHRCRYDLRDHADDAVCPECGTPVWRSLISEENRAQIELEDRMLSREHLYHRSRAGSIFLAGGGIVAFVALLCISTLLTAPSPAASISVGMSLWTAILWVVVAWALHGKVQHCRSIRWYRSRLGGPTGGTGKRP